jgi:guanylate kinase
MTATQFLPLLLRSNMSGRGVWDGVAPRLITLTGTSGSGKRLLARSLERHDVIRITSITTRPPRAQETPGLDYDFVDAKMFAKTLCEGGLIECNRHAGDWYGVTRDSLAAAEMQGRPMYLVLNPQGVRRMRVVAEERGWRMQTVFLRQSRARLARTLIRRLHSSGPESVCRGQQITDLWRNQTGWEAGLRWDVIVGAPAGNDLAQLAESLVQIARLSPSGETIVPLHDVPPTWSLSKL